MAQEKTMIPQFIANWIVAVKTTVSKSKIALAITKN